MKSLQPDHCIGRQPTANGLSKLFHTTGIVTLFSNVISKLKIRPEADWNAVGTAPRGLQPGSSQAM